ncbi:MAG: phenylacetate-CoA oxygenase subunit PaaJ [Chloroflexota bacterium]
MGIKVEHDDIMAALATVDDPELPISIVQLGIVRQVEMDDQGQVQVVVNPTFCGCPALSVIEQRIREAVSRVEGVSAVKVQWLFSPDWDVEALTNDGIAALKAFGIAVPVTHKPLSCPYCDSTEVVRESAFGPTLCRSLYHCRSCRNPFEVMKQLNSCRVSGIPVSMRSLRS